MQIREVRKKLIKKQLSNLSAADVKMYHFLIRKAFLSNQDFRIAADGSWGESREIIEKETGQKILFPVTAIANQELIDLWNVMEQQDFEQKKLKKAECIDQMVTLLSDDTMFEGFCLAFYGEDEELEVLCKEFRCMEQYLALLEDPVYQKRKTYQKMIRRYAKAAVNLYGVIHVVELEMILKKYEKEFMDQAAGFERSTGGYRETVMYQPKYHCLHVFQNVVGNGVPEVLTSLDGLFMHMCFKMEYMAESAHMVDYFNTRQYREIGEKELKEFFFDETQEFAHRRVLIERMDKPPYAPGKKEFLKYEDEDYREESLAERQLKKYLKKKYRRNFGKVADKLDLTAEQCIEDFVEEIYYHVSDRNSLETKEPTEVIDFVFAALVGYEIPMKTEQMNELLSYLVQMINSIRLWRSNGNTPTELAQIRPIDSKNLTFVPESSMAAEGLKEYEEELKQMGIKIDFQQNAKEVPVFSYPSGINGTMEKSIKKVYPNDPCPCGSGKKFKKCCGR